MDVLPQINTYAGPIDVELHPHFTVRARPSVAANNQDRPWSDVAALLVDASSINLSSNCFQSHQISVASIEINSPVEITVQFTTGGIQQAKILPASRGINVTLQNSNTVQFTVDGPRDVMLEINSNKWLALHLLINAIDPQAPTEDTKDVWYFGPGINNGKAYEKVVDGKLKVPSGTTVYLAAGAFLTAGLHFIEAQNAAVRGHGFIYKPKTENFILEKQGAILIEKSCNISIEGVTSLSATGFSFLAGQSKGIHVNAYRSFSSSGNGDGIHFLSCSDVVVENCFLRNSDDTIAINCHRWDYYGNSENIIIRNCTLLPDVAHPILIGTHGNPAKPECIRNVHISNVDILDHEENQLWYQGCVALNAGDGNLIEQVHLEDIRIEKITKGQLLNIRVMQNAMWTTAPGRGIRDVTIRNMHLDLENSKVVNQSQILGYDNERRVENIRFQNLVIGDKSIHECMSKPRWYMVADFVPAFINEHVHNLKFTLE